MTTPGFRTTSQLAALLSALALLGAAGPASADAHEVAWDQAKVTGLTAVLATALHEIVNDPAMSGKQANAFQDRNLHAALVDIKQMAGTARKLADQLQAGASPEQTRPVFQQILLTRQDVRMYVQNSEISPSVQSKAANAIQAMDQLQKFYAAY